jgi:anti-sigma28 factor (negative regulator of flagellin synthesis)
MAGVRGVGGVPEPAPERTTEIRERKREEVRNLAPQDGVRISPTAQLAAEVAKIREMTQEDPDIRPERVAAAKERLARGDYKRADVVAKVAERIAEQLGE